MASSSKRLRPMEAKNEWNLEKLLGVCESDEQILDFLKEKGLLKTEMKCDKCGWGMRVSGLRWNCYRRVKTKKGTKVCGRTKSIKKETWFSRTKLSFKNVLILTYMLINNYEQRIISEEMRISEVTVSHWGNFIKQVLVEWLMLESQPVGGPERTIELKEAKTVKRKYHGGCAEEGQWVLGGLERETKRIFLAPVPDRSAQTLMALIQKWILPGSTVITKCWRSCNPLGEEGYEHLRVNHSLGFVDSGTEAHTNTIEAIRGHIRVFSPSYSRKKDNFSGYLAYYAFKKMAKDKKIDLFDAFLNQVAKINFDIQGDSIDEIC